MKRNVGQPTATSDPTTNINIEACQSDCNYRSKCRNELPNRPEQACVLLIACIDLPASHTTLLVQKSVGYLSCATAGLNIHIDNQCRIMEGHHFYIKYWISETFDNVIL